MGLLPFVKDRITLLLHDENDLLVDAIEIDATLSANHKSPSKVSRHPVAKGKSIVDNVRPEADGLTLECFWGNRPGDIIEMAKRYAKGDFQHAEAQYVKLKEARRKANKITINMRIWTYENMVIEDISVPETVDDGSSITATVVFSEIETASAQTVKATVKPATTGNGPKNVVGGQAKAPQPAASPPAQSALSRGTDQMGWTSGLKITKP